MKGRRIYSSSEMIAGDYYKMGNKEGNWLICTPIGTRGMINNTWNIEEHEDGSITVSPSIRVWSNGDPKTNWHGYLIKGEWKEC